MGKQDQQPGSVKTHKTLGFLGYWAARKIVDFGGGRWDLTALYHPNLFRIYLNHREQLWFTSKESLGNLTRQMRVE